MQSRPDYKKFIAWKNVRDAIDDFKTSDITPQLKVLQLFSSEEAQERKQFLEIHNEYKIPLPNLSPFILDLPDEKGETLLMIAARVGKYSIVKQLINEGAFLHIKNAEGHTVLDRAVLHDNYILCDLLSSEGATYSEKVILDRLNKGPNFFANKEYGAQPFLHWLNVLIKLKPDLDVNKWMINGDPVLIFTIKNLYYDATLKLLELGANPLIKAMSYCLNNNLELCYIEALIAHGATFEPEELYKKASLALRVEGPPFYNALAWLSVACDQGHDPIHIQELKSHEKDIDAVFEDIMKYEDREKKPQSLLPRELYMIVRGYLFFDTRPVKQLAESKDLPSQKSSIGVNKQGC